MWTRIGLAACFGIGTIVGILMCVLNWEAWLQ